MGYDYGKSKIDAKFLINTTIGQIVQRNKLLNLTIGNKNWKPFLKILMGALRRGYLDNPVVLLALFNCHTSGVTEKVNEYQEMTQLMASTPGAIKPVITPEMKYKILQDAGYGKKFREDLQNSFAQSLLTDGKDKDKKKDDE